MGRRWSRTYRRYYLWRWRRWLHAMLLVRDDRPTVQCKFVFSKLWRFITSQEEKLTFIKPYMLATGNSRGWRIC